MPLLIGTRIGPYEIVAPLGAGGMGEVYRARDTRLNRDVALKILPDLVAADDDRLARFEREAQVLASLNHPHIGAIYGLEESTRSGQAAIRALVLELVEGPTLADRIARGPMPLDEALPIARQIAEALEAAHEQGIVHRDLKPANIIIQGAWGPTLTRGKASPLLAGTPPPRGPQARASSVDSRPRVSDGTVKVLDFGLARALQPVSAVGDPSQSPTLTSPAAMTEMGVILGTAAYMSPEQAKGRQADKRSDVWAFGCVLYEMLTGTRAFPGDGVSDTLASVLRGEPDWNALPPAATPIAGVLQRCLEKDVRRRLRDIGDVKLWLEDAVARAPDTRSARVSGIRSWWMAAAAALGIVAGGTMAAVLMRSRGESIAPLVSRFELPTPQTDPFSAEVSGANVAVSPDGSRIVYTATRRGASELVMRRLEQLEAIPIAGTEGGSDPFFSPDGRHIGFAAGGQLKSVATDGGASTIICPLDPTFSGGSWGLDNMIVFTQRAVLWRVSATGGQAEKLAEPDATNAEAYYDRPAFLPDGQSVLYTVTLRSGEGRIVARQLRSGKTTTLVEGGFGAQYLPSGHLVYGIGDHVMAIRLDATTLHVAGAAVVVQEGVFTKIDDIVANLASASNGMTVYVAGRATGMSGRPVWVDRGGTHVARIVESPLEYPRNPRLSPDGHRLALTVGRGGMGHIWVYDLTGGAQPLKLTFQDHNTFPIWSPDGKQIVFHAVSGPSFKMLSIRADGSGAQPEPVTTTDIKGVPVDWSPDGAFVLFREPAKTKFALLNMSDHTSRRWLQTPFAEFGGRFSPDGHWLTYGSNQTGAAEVWVRPFPGPGAPTRISSEGGHDPVWSRDGGEILYDNGPKLMSARVVSMAPELRVEAPRVLFEGGFVHEDTDLNLRYFDVAPDGRLLMIEPTQIAKAPSIVVAPHWDEELKRLLPIK